MITIEEFLDYDTKTRSSYINKRISGEGTFWYSGNLFKVLNIIVNPRVTIDGGSEWINIKYDLTEPIPGDSNTTPITSIQDQNIFFRYVEEKDSWVWVDKTLRIPIYRTVYGSYDMNYWIKKGDIYSTPLKYLILIRQKAAKYQGMLKRIENEYKEQKFSMIPDLVGENIKGCVSFDIVQAAWKNYLSLGVDDEKYFYLYLILYGVGTSVILTREIKAEFGVDSWRFRPPKEASKEKLDRLEEFLETRIPKIAESIGEATGELKRRVKRELNEIVNKFGIFRSDITVIINGEEI